MSFTDNPDFAPLLALPIVDQILKRLREELDPKLKYHCFEHTIDVVQNSIVLARANQLPDEQIELLVIAAAFHDAGFLTRREDNERLGAAMAEQAMKEHGYSEAKINLVKQAILDTAMIDDSQDLIRTASTELSKYLLDADSANVGTDSFFASMEAIAEESSISPVEMRKQAQRFISGHVWFTAPAQRMFEKTKQKNLKELSALMAAKTSGS